MIVDADGAHPAIPGSEQPTQALGWLDASTLLVSAGGCGQPAQLSAVGATAQHATLLVDGVDIGAPRTVLRDAPTEVPAPPDERRRRRPEASGDSAGDGGRSAATPRRGSVVARPRPRA